MTAALRLLMRALLGGEPRRRAAPAVLAVCAVALGVAVEIAVASANATALASFRSGVDVVSDRVTFQIGGVAPFDEHLLLRVQALPGVVSASPVVEGEVLVGAGRGSDGRYLHVIGVDVTRAAAALPPGLLQTPLFRDPSALATFIDGDGVLISSEFARSLHLYEGEELPALAGARPVRLRIMGFFDARRAGVDATTAVTDLATAQPLFGEIGTLDRIDVVAAPAAEDRLSALLRRALPASVGVERPRQRFDEAARMLESFRLNLGVLSAVALVVGMFLIVNVVAFGVVRRRAQIGTLRALGVSRTAIAAAFVGEGAIYGATGGLLGVIAGAVLARGAVAAVQQTVSALYFSAQGAQVVLSPETVIRGYAAGVIASTAAAALPAVGAARIPPSAVMRAQRGYEFRDRVPVSAAAIGTVLVLLTLLAAALPPVGAIPIGGYLAGACAICGAALLMPAFVIATVRVLRAAGVRGATWTPVLAFTAAAPRRIATATAALATALGLALAIGILVTSFRDTVIAWTDRVLPADLYLSAPGPPDAQARGYFTPRTVAAIERVPGVAGVDLLRTVQLPLDGSIAQLLATGARVFVERYRGTFADAPPGPVLVHALRAGEIAVSVPLAVHLHVRRGDTLALPTPLGIRTARIAAVYDDYSTGLGSLMIDRRLYERLFGDHTVDSIAVNVRHGASPERVRAAVAAAVAPLRVEIDTDRDIRAFALQVFDRTFAITKALYGIALLVALLGMGATFAAMVVERDVEIGLLRYVGATRRGTAAIVLAQALLVGLLAAVVGTMLGLALASILIDIVDRQSFGWLIEWHAVPQTIARTILPALVAAPIAAVVPAIHAAGLRVSEVLRVE